jgi:hypothetical protein
VVFGCVTPTRSPKKISPRQPWGLGVWVGGEVSPRPFTVKQQGLWRRRTSDDTGQVVRRSPLLVALRARGVHCRAADGGPKSGPQGYHLIVESQPKGSGAKPSAPIVSTSCPLFSSLGQAPIVVCNSERSFPCRFIIYFVSENAHLLRALEPMLGIVDERSEHPVTSLDEWSASA